MVVPVPVDVDALRLPAPLGIGDHSDLFRDERRDNTLLQLRADAVDVLDHLPDVPAVKFRRVKAVPLCDQRPFEPFMGAVQRDHKIFAVTLPGQRLEAGIVIQRPIQGAVIFEPDIIIVQDERVGDPHDHPADLLQAASQSVILAEPVVPACFALRGNV